MDNATQGSGCGMCGSGKGCGCVHHSFGAILVVLFALAFLLKNLGVLSEGVVGVAWPIIVGVAGLLKLTGGKCKCC